MTESTLPSRNPGVLVLAAGFSRRYGADGSKLSALLNNGLTVLQQTLQQIRGATDNIVLVTRQELLDEGLLDTGICHLGSWQKNRPVQLVISTEAHKGMGHTLAQGISRVTDWDACLVCLGDMPFIRTATYQQLLAALSSENIVVPEFQQLSGHPVGFGSDFFPALGQLSGDSGGRTILQQHPDRIVYVPVTDAAVLQDVDTPTDLKRWQ